MTPLLLHWGLSVLRIWRGTQFFLSGSTLGAWISGLSLLAWGRDRYQRLSTVQPLPSPKTRLPSLSIIVPACNEAGSLEPAMQSLLALNYPCLEIIAVNDRSTDATGEILDRLAARYPRLRVLHIKDLPSGWLGKNHAMHQGSEAATGEWLLFTDADVVYSPDALERAVAYSSRRDIDHLVVAPRCETHGFWERLFLSFFTLMFSFRIRIWEINNPRKSAYAGLGAFNLVRAAAYRKFGGHAAMPMEAVDDMKLGKLLKCHGFRAEFLQGSDLISVRWMVGLRGVVSGLTKNAFAAYEFDPLRSLGGVVGLFLTGLIPFFALVWGTMPSRLMAMGTMACMLTGANSMRRTTGAQAGYGLAYPLAALILIYVILRSTWRTYRQDGIIWRGTRYSLRELRDGIV